MTKGMNTSGDVLVNVTADGVDLNVIWSEIAEALQLYNQQRSALAQLLSYPTTLAADAVPQSISSESFETATEFGVPHGIVAPSDYLKLGYNYRDYDLALRFTWKFLRDATSDQVVAQTTRAIEADNKLVTGTILNRLFSPATYYNEWGHSCYGLYNADMTPPPYLGRTFSSDTKHYLTTRSDVLDSEDVEFAINTMRVKGYGTTLGSQYLIFANPDDVAACGMTAWRAGVQYRTGGSLPLYDFVPSGLLPAWISAEVIHGPTPPTEFNGLQVWGSYGGALLIQTNFVPAGWVAVVASGGADSDLNPVGFRQHVNTAYQGLRHIPGHGPYPIQESFMARGFGVGVRNRGAAVCLQITEDTSYTAPTTIPV
jgi:hypothetical protein